MPDRLLRSCHVSGSVCLNGVELQQHAGQHLPDLVVQPACDPFALGFLRRQRSTAAFLALGLQAVEHLIEGAHESPEIVSGR